MYRRRLRVNLRRREAWLGEQSLKLTNAEFVILVTLMRSPGEVVSREALTRTALGRQLLPDDRSLDTHISNLRRKVGSDDERRRGDPQHPRQRLRARAAAGVRP